MKNRKFYISQIFHKFKMILEEVMPHPNREDIYINQIVTPHNQIKDSDKSFVNRILLKEFARKRAEISH